MREWGRGYALEFTNYVIRQLNMKEFFNKIYTKASQIMTDKHLSVLAFVCVCLGLGIMIFFVSFIFINLKFSWGHNVSKETIETIGNIGDFFGGVLGSFWALTAVFLLYLTLKMQKEELVNQRTELQNTRTVFEIQKFESTFFNLLQNQKHLLSELKIEAPIIEASLGKFNARTEVFTGLNVLIECRNQLAIVFDVLSSKGKYDKDEIQRQLDNLLFEFRNENHTVDTNNEDYKERIESLLRVFKRAHFADFYSITNKEKKLFRELTMDKKCELAYGIFSEVYSPVIGHYFRHLYQMLKFIDLSEKSLESLTQVQSQGSSSKHNFNQYAQFIQSQMSSPELLMSFYNAACFTKALNLINQYNLLENLSYNLLIDESHNGSFKITLKKVDTYFRDTIYQNYIHPKP